ncbi:hypothetical protein E8E12_004895 [Didymella heteroderae]|uniref:Uncharacterized protein n=1 Tax=Didymella heteroderae TaxID=1769908 RepID=A0A9P4WRB2_9PLEO|nr:hypothetical protein E8E12_004895 [Didymella heteroderae]
MPPEGLKDFDWTPNAAVAPTMSEIGKTPHHWHTLPLTLLTILVVVWILQRFANMAVSCWKKTVLYEIRRTSAPVACKKTLGTKTYDVPKEAKCGTSSCGKAVLAVSLIQDVHPHTECEFSMEKLEPIQTTNFTVESAKSRMLDGKMSANLALSDIMVAVDIAPSPLKQDDDGAVAELSELLRRW